MTRPCKFSVAVCCSTLLAMAPVLGAQTGDLDARLANVHTGLVRLTFTARPDVCGNGNSISTHSSSHGVSWRSGSSDVAWDEECDHGPVHVVIDVRDQLPTAIRAYVGGHWRAPSGGGPPVVDWGAVPAPDAAAWFLHLARRLPATPGHDAIFPAVLADSAIVWPTLVALARDAMVPASTRKQALFWLGQAASDATASLDSIAGDSSIDEQVRAQAIFALSQRPADEGIPALIRVAKSNTDPELRRKALFWLGQSQDPRAVDLFEQILTEHP
jgi:hypothetical protein